MSKILLSVKGTNEDGSQEVFADPVIQTAGKLR